MRSVAVGIFCKTPAAGFSKTRLSPPLRPEECGMLSACFIRDLAATIHGLSLEGEAAPYAVYTPAGTEDRLRALLPPSFRLLLQCDGDFGVRLSAGHRRSAAMPAMPAQSWSMPTARRCRLHPARRRSRRCAATDSRGARTGHRRRLHADRAVAAARPGVRGHSLEHGRRLSPDGRARRRDRRAGRRPCRGWYDVDDRADLAHAGGGAGWRAACRSPRPA